MVICFFIFFVIFLLRLPVLSGQCGESFSLFYAYSELLLFKSLVIHVAEKKIRIIDIYLFTV
jgi:hypothetical protein